MEWAERGRETDLHFDSDVLFDAPSMAVSLGTALVVIVVIVHNLLGLHAEPSQAVGSIYLDRETLFSNRVLDMELKSFWIWVWI